MFIGLGCTQLPVSTPTTTPQIVIKKKPDTADIKIQAQNFCEARGYELIIRFDKTAQSSGSFCRFKDGSECEAVAFFTGKCVPGNKGPTATSTPPIKTNSLLVCTTDYNPVCGANGINYTNSCVAQAQGIKIARNGVCLNKDIINAQENEPAIKTAESKGEIKTTNNIIIEKLSPESWLPIVKDMVISNPPSDPPAFIEKCTVAGRTYYFRSDGCTNCFAVLYDIGGIPVCYPNNDINSDCPASFDKTYRSKYCTRIWQDPR